MPDDNPEKQDAGFDETIAVDLPSKPTGSSPDKQAPKKRHHKASPSEARAVRPSSLLRIGVFVILLAWMFVVGVMAGRSALFRDQTLLDRTPIREAAPKVKPATIVEAGEEPTIIAQMNGRKSLIIVSNFKNDALFGDPAAKAAALKAKYGDIGIYTVSFAADAEGVRRAKSLARSGRCGRYFDGAGLLDSPGKFKEVVRDIFTGSLDDQDLDGVCNSADKCPDTKGADRVDENGCPVAITISLHIEFTTGRSDIRPEYRDQISAVAEKLTEYPETVATVEGHTDDQGSDQVNQRLSQQRAESVRSYLIKEFGISQDRIRAKGYGEANPVADNATEEGRQKNRRVDVVIDSAFKS